MMQDHQGHLWFATRNGVSRNDGQHFKTFTSADGLADDYVTSIFQDSNDYLWFATRGGATCYDGFTFQTLNERDGLTHNEILQIHQDRSGDIWFGTKSGLTRYRPAQTPPAVRISDVVAGTNCGPLARVDLTSSQSSISIAFQGHSMTTPWDRMAYAFQIAGPRRQSAPDARQPGGIQRPAPGRLYSLQSKPSTATSIIRSSPPGSTSASTGWRRVSSIFQDNDGHMWFVGAKVQWPQEDWGGVSRTRQ